MTYAAHDQTFEQRLAKVNLTAVMAHVAAETNLSSADLASAEELYRHYLTLKAQNPEALLVPPRVVDTVWHTHITFTRQYAADCELLFGQFLHHTPSVEGAEELFETQTVPAMLKHFNVNLRSLGLQQPELYTSTVCG